MKMLEICLKLVGCKSKKGLSSSSSCYLEGKNDFAAYFCSLLDQLGFISELSKPRCRKEKIGRDQEGGGKDEVSPHSGNDFCTVETQERGGESGE